MSHNKSRQLERTSTHLEFGAVLVKTFIHHCCHYHSHSSLLLAAIVVPNEHRARLDTCANRYRSLLISRGEAAILQRMNHQDMCEFVDAPHARQTPLQRPQPPLRFRCDRGQNGGKAPPTRFWREIDVAGAPTDQIERIWHHKKPHRVTYLCARVCGPLFDTTII